MYFLHTMLTCVTFSWILDSLRYMTFLLIQWKVSSETRNSEKGFLFCIYLFVTFYIFLEKVWWDYYVFISKFCNFYGKSYWFNFEGFLCVSEHVSLLLTLNILEGCKMKIIGNTLNLTYKWGKTWYFIWFVYFWLYLFSNLLFSKTLSNIIYTILK